MQSVNVLPRTPVLVQQTGSRLDHGPIDRPGSAEQIQGTLGASVVTLS